VAVWSQSGSFFWQINPNSILRDEPRLRQGYHVTEFLLEATYLEGAQMTAKIARAMAKSGRPVSAHRRRFGVAAAIVLAPAIMFFPQSASADENGISFWVPGFFGSLAATPQQPGWSLANIYYHTSVSAGADVARSREFTLNRVPANFTVNTNLNLHVNATGDLGFVIPSYVFATPVLGGQASVSLLAAYGVVGTSLAGTLSGVVTGPLGNSVPFARSDTIMDTTWGFGDLAPVFQLKWNAGVHNYMAYIMGDIPVGAYDSTRLSNIGIGHGAIDTGGGYTYFNPQTGHEISGVLGFTYNFVNPSTQYQSGVDMHFDWGASQFLSKQVMVGLVGYVYKELGCDSGSGDRVGCFQSQVVGVGPQIGFLFPVGDMQGYLNIKAYGEFAAENRPSGWNSWVTFSISPPAPGAPPTTKPIVRKY
jgi:hypothetical protein